MGYVHIYIYNLYTYTDYTNINKCPADIWWFSQQYAVVFARVTCSGSGEVAWSLQEHGYFARNTWNKNKTHEEMQATNRWEIGITKLSGCDLSDVKHVVIVEDIKVEDVHIGVRDTVRDTVLKHGMIQPWHGM